MLSPESSALGRAAARSGVLAAFRNPLPGISPVNVRDESMWRDTYYNMSGCARAYEVAEEG